MLTIFFNFFFYTHVRIDRRKNSSRRRPFDSEADINYINEPNMRFNQAIERAFGKHTQGIKDDLERGTAL